VGLKIGAVFAKNLPDFRNMQAQVEKIGETRPTGELLAVENGKVTGVRVLGGGKLEYSYQGIGKLLGVDAMSTYTALGTMQPDGVMIFEANGVVRTIEGDALTVKIWGVNYPKGLGFKASGRGGAITQTISPKLTSRLNNTPNVWEAETDEAGDYQLKVWEWK
jgi:hypothetical protein